MYVPQSVNIIGVDPATRSSFGPADVGVPTSSCHAHVGAGGDSFLAFTQLLHR